MNLLTAENPKDDRCRQRMMRQWIMRIHFANMWFRAILFYPKRRIRNAFGKARTEKQEPKEKQRSRGT